VIENARTRKTLKPKGQDFENKFYFNFKQYNSNHLQRNLGSFIDDQEMSDLKKNFLQFSSDVWSQQIKNEQPKIIEVIPVQ